ncbi:MAG TPA: putative Ig domain-containing protein [Planctomycetota bacterium]|nr:putative Ig domain-containing protein [Planctomycetota bacterium]
MRSIRSAAAIVISLSLLFSGASMAGQAGPCYLVKRTNPTQVNSDSIPGGMGATEFAYIGNTGYFHADDGVHGIQLFKTDGTPAGTSMVHYFEDQPLGFVELTPVGSTLYFIEYLGGPGSLWKTDGTDAGTVRLLANSPLSQLCALGNGKLLFNNDVLYVSDGTPAGTQPVVPSNTHYIGGGGIVNLNGIGYFVGYDSTNGYQLWHSDGSTAGTAMVTNIASGNTNLNLRHLTVSGSYVYFTSDSSNYPRELWRSDGTAAGTLKIQTFFGQGCGGLIDVGGTLVFYAQDASSNQNIYKSDGNSTSIIAANSYIDPSTWSVANSKLYYADNNVYELDPAGGLGIVKIAQGIAQDNSPKPCLAIGNLVYFACAGVGGSSDGYGNELHANDRSAASNNNYLVADINSTTTTVGGNTYNNDSNPGNFFNFNGKLFFTAFDGYHGIEPFISSGSGATMVKDINTVPPSSLAANPISANGLAFFDAQVTSGAGQKLCRSDGTAAGTDVTDGAIIYSVGGSRASFKNALYFGGNYYGLGLPPPKDYQCALYATAGSLNTDATLIAGLDKNGGAVSDLLVLDSTHLLFTATLSTSAGTKGLYVTNGTAGNSTLLASSFELGGYTLYPGKVLNGFAYYVAAPDNSGEQIMAVNGSSAPVPFFSQIPSICQDEFGVSQRLFVAGNHLMFFIGAVLYSTDGIAAPQVVKDFSSIGQFSGKIAVSNGNICFLAGGQLWKSNGLTATAVTTGTEAFRFSNPVAPVDVNGTLYIPGNTATGNNPCLVKSDLTANGTVMVHTFANSGYFPSNLFNASGTLVFAYQDYFAAQTFGLELWRSDGTDAGTVMVQDINYGSASSSPRQFCVAGSNLFFIADQRYGNDPAGVSTDLWAMPLSALTLPAPSVTTQTLVYGGTVGVAMTTIQFSATNGPNTFSILNLPPGLSFDTSSGAISGTPTSPGDYTSTVSATNGNAIGAAQILIHIGGNAPEFATKPSFGTIQNQQTITYTPVVTGLTPLTFSTTGTVPGWVNLNTSTGVITATPTANNFGAFSFKLVATNSAGSANQTVSGTGNPLPPVITGPLTASASVGAGFSYTIQATGSGTLSYNFPNITPSQDWMSFDYYNGEVYGVPDTVTTYNITLHVQDLYQQSDTKVLVLTVTNTPPPTASIAATTPTASEDTPSNGVFTVTLSAAQASATTVNFTVGGSAVAGTDYTSIGTSVQIPANQTSATVTVAPIQDLNYTINTTVIATLASGSGYAVGSPGSATVNILDLGPGNIVAPAITSALSGSTTVGANYSYKITATGTGPITYSFSNIPSGFVFDNVDTITGSFSTEGNYQFGIKAANAGGSDSKTVNVSVAASGSPQLAISSGPLATPNTVNVLQDVNFFVAASNAVGALTYDWNFGDGTKVSVPGSGSVTYFYSAGGTYNVSVTITDSVTSQTVTGTTTVTVNAAPALSLLYKPKITLTFAGKATPPAPSYIITFSAVFPAPAGFDPAKAVITANVGGVVWQTGDKFGGVGLKNSNGSCAVTMLGNDAASLGALAKLNLSNVAAKKKAVTVPVYLFVDSTVFTGTANLHYTTTAKKKVVVSGTAK